MDDDLKAAIAEVEAFGRLIDAERETSEAFTVEDKAMRRMVRAQRTLISALRQRDEALESVRAERDLYRLVAVNQGWNWRLCDAYGRDEYQKQREKHVDDCVAVAQSHAARTILTGSETNAR